MNQAGNIGADLFVISPEIALASAGFVAVILGLLSSRVSRHVVLAVALAGLASCLMFAWQLWDSNTAAFGSMIKSDNFALAFLVIFVVGAALSIMLAFNHREESYLLYPEFVAIALFATIGMILMAASSNLLVLFLGLETLSISLYVLAGINRTDEHSLESAFKYFLLGAFASAFLLYGIALIFGATGSLDLGALLKSGTGFRTENAPLLFIGSLLVVVGLGFKVAMFPFHMWAPDVYQGAPAPIAAFMSTGSKAAGFAAMLRVMFALTDAATSQLLQVFWVLAVLTMFFGNITAIAQKNVKRMLAYSSIAHAGYILVGIVAWNQVGLSSVLFYLLSYTFMNIGAFGIIAYLGSKDKEFCDFSDFKGLGHERPWLAIAMALFMFSLAGLPPTSGFLGKFYLFSAAVKAGHIPLVIIGVINSMISLYYYLGVVVVMFMKESDGTSRPKLKAPVVAVSLAAAAIGVLGIGFFPSRLMATLETLISHVL